MTETLPDTDNAPARRGKAKRTRRNYVAELTDLQARVDMAVKLLGKSNALASGRTTATDLVDVAIQTLTGDL